MIQPMLNCEDPVISSIRAISAGPIAKLSTGCLVALVGRMAQHQRISLALPRENVDLDGFWPGV